MPRKPDILCAGTCGRLIWRGRGTLPEGQSMCRECRSGRPLGSPKASPREAICPAPGCGTVFTAELLRNGTHRRTCSRACRFAVARAGRTSASCELMARPCPDCATPVFGKHPMKRCPDCKALRTRLNWYRKNAARRGINPQTTMTIAELGDRDGWRCHLCSKPVDKILRGNDPMAPTYDHLIPVVDGGDDAPENLRLAHRICNTKRGAGGVVQLLLVG